GWRGSAGVSREERVLLPGAGSLRFPGGGSPAQGESRPKPRPKGVGDGQQVDIPVPPPFRLNDGGTQEDKECALMDMCAQAVRVLDRQIRPTHPELSWGGNYSTEVADSTLPRKSSSEERGARSANRHW